MSLEPLYDKVLIQRKDGETVTPGGIIIPDAAKEKPVFATIIAVGCGRFTNDGSLVPLIVHKGDEVLVGKYAGSDVKIGGHEYTILREDEILGITKRASSVTETGNAFPGGTT